MAKLAIKSITLDDYKYSTLDKSVNIPIYCEDESTGIRHLFECRWVQRQEGQLIYYISSQSGCSQSCKMCHLTQTGQNKNVMNASVAIYFAQYTALVEYTNRLIHQGKLKQESIKQININFMARGEPLLNIVNLNSFVIQAINTTFIHNVKLHFNISTIFPRGIDYSKLIDLAVGVTEYPHAYLRIYYSLYSVDEKKRKKWLPNAMSHKSALVIMDNIQEISFAKYPDVIHFAFIEGFNDKEQDMFDMASEINTLYKLDLDVNIVRYNPADNIGAGFVSNEPSEDRVNLLAGLFFGALNKKRRLQVVPRVGFDVKASCGMFLNEGE